MSAHDVAEGLKMWANRMAVHVTDSDGDDREAVFLSDLIDELNVVSYGEE